MISGKHDNFYYAFGRFYIKAPVKDGFLAIDPRCVSGPRHITACILTAIDSIKHNQAVARDVRIEFLVRLTGQRQIKKAEECLKKSGDVILVWIANKNPPNLDLEEKELKSSPDELDAIERRLLIT